MTDDSPFQYVRILGGRLESSGWWHSFELPDGTLVEGANDLPGLKGRVAQYPIPQDLRGKRVLDIGAWDGWFSFEMERRGAEVVAIDNWDNPRFHQMRAALGSKVDYRIMDVYDLTPERVGRFDIVLFLGVLYHLKHPILALERVCALTTDLCIVESFVLQEEHRPGEDVERRPIMEFYELDELGGQTDNWVGPTVPCLMAFCRTAGFGRVDLANVTQYGATLACYRGWVDEVDKRSAAPHLTAALHNPRLGVNVSTRRDDYVSCFFSWEPSRRQKAELSLDDVQPEVSGYGTRPIYVGPGNEGGYQANFKLPPGLEPGWNPVRVRVRNGAPSNAVTIAVDMPEWEGRPAILEVTDAATGATNELDLASGRELAVTVDGLPEHADRTTVMALIDEGRLPVTNVAPAGQGSQGPRRVTAEVPEGLPAGSYRLRVAMDRGESDPVPLTVRA